MKFLLTIAFLIIASFASFTYFGTPERATATLSFGGDCGNSGIDCHTPHATATRNPHEGPCGDSYRDCKETKTPDPEASPTREYCSPQPFCRQTATPVPPTRTIAPSTSTPVPPTIAPPTSSPTVNPPTASPPPISTTVPTTTVSPTDPTPPPTSTATTVPATTVPIQTTAPTATATARSVPNNPAPGNPPAQAMAPATIIVTAVSTIAPTSTSIVAGVQIARATALPKTGGVPIDDILTAAALLIGIGLIFRHRATPRRDDGSASYHSWDR